MTNGGAHWMCRPTTYGGSGHLTFFVMSATLPLLSAGILSIETRETFALVFFFLFKRKKITSCSYDTENKKQQKPTRKEGKSSQFL